MAAEMCCEASPIVYVDRMRNLIMLAITLALTLQACGGSDPAGPTCAQAHHECFVGCLGDRPCELVCKDEAAACFAAQ
jgi:hypothetical protein